MRTCKICLQTKQDEDMTRTSAARGSKLLNTCKQCKAIGSMYYNSNKAGKDVSGMLAAYADLVRVMHDSIVPGAIPKVVKDALLEQYGLVEETPVKPEVSKEDKLGYFSSVVSRVKADQVNNDSVDTLYDAFIKNLIETVDLSIIDTELHVAIKAIELAVRSLKERLAGSKLSPKLIKSFELAKETLDNIIEFPLDNNIIFGLNILGDDVDAFESVRSEWDDTNETAYLANISAIIKDLNSMLGW